MSPRGPLAARLMAGAAGSILMILAGCSPTEPLLATLEENRATWESRRPASYAFDFRSECYCGWPDNLTLRIGVEGDAVAEIEIVLDVRNPPDPPEPQLSWGYTVDGIFDEIARMAATDPDVLEVTWDPYWGIPLTVDYDPSRSVADDERRLILWDLTPRD